MGKKKKILNCEVMKALSFILGSPFLYLCATGQFAGHGREVSPSIKNQRRFCMCSMRRIISETAMISVMFSLLESKKICIVYMTIVASGYSLRENRRQRFLILVTLVTTDLKTRQFQF